MSHDKVEMIRKLEVEDICLMSNESLSQIFALNPLLEFSVQLFIASWPIFSGILVNDVEPKN